MMPGVPGPKRYGGVASANDYNALQQAVANNSTMLGNGEIEFDAQPGGFGVRDNRPRNFWAVIKPGSNGNYYSWAKCDDTAESGALSEMDDQNYDKSYGNYNDIPACEVNGRLDVPTGHRVRLFQYGDGSGLGFIYDGVPSYGYSTGIHTYSTVSWSSMTDIGFSGCTVTISKSRFTLTSDSTGGLMLFETPSSSTAALGPFPLHGTVTVEIPSQSGTISGTAGSCTVTGTVSVPGQTVTADLSGNTACP